MKTRNLLLLVLALAGILVVSTGCSSASEATAQPSATLTQQVPVVPVDPNAYGNDIKLMCANGLLALEIGIGKQVEGPAVYSLTETRGDVYPYKNVQLSVTLHVQPPKGESVVSAIVHTTGTVDKEFRANVGDGGVLDAQLLTSNYARFPEYSTQFPINSITLCIKAAG